MEPITVKVPALLVMVQAIANAQMDYVTLSTETAPGGVVGYLHFQAYHRNDPQIAFLLHPAGMAMKDEFAASMRNTLSALFAHGNPLH